MARPGKQRLPSIAEESEPATPAVEAEEHERDVIVESVDLEQADLAQSKSPEMEPSSSNSTTDESFVTASSSLALSSRSSSSSMTIAVPGTSVLCVSLLASVSHRASTFSFLLAKTTTMVWDPLKVSRSIWREAWGLSSSSILTGLAPRESRISLVGYSGLRPGLSPRSPNGRSGSSITRRPSVSHRGDFFHIVFSPVPFRFSSLIQTRSGYPDIVFGTLRSLGDHFISVNSKLFHYGVGSLYWLRVDVTFSKVVAHAGSYSEWMSESGGS
ncbi:hypothetical protein FA13DRAFT_232787 [Coprinellus micaceus]|uniref:Uncharacterized protein n=1 Tax=Coprinellus micaceus TaxID=71717 RepID=A0A4Y7TFH4_COPMI|nr:hypothetical protein FA13DRAFT_232787 [Coprinellus micaceus]